MTGKEKCKYLKELRATIAEAYNISGFEYKECEFQGECDGTCPVCDEEAQLLYDKLKERGLDVDASALKSNEEYIKNTESRPKRDRLEGKVKQRPRDDDKIFMEGDIIDERHIQTVGIMLSPEADSHNKSHSIRGNMQKITPNNIKEKTDNVKEKPRGLRGLFKKKK